MRILITGSTGFLGKSVARFAAGTGHEVTGIARRSQADPDWPGSHFAADVASADLTAIIEQARPELIFHGAGTASVGASFSSPLEDLRAATMTLANLLDSVRRSAHRPLVIFPSSAAVYGNPATLPVPETALAAPISPYGFHKLAGEKIAEEYSLCFGLDTLVCRIFSVFGPAQRRLLVWDIYQQLMGPGQTVELRGTGTESRDYLYADDLAAGLLALAKKLPRQNGGSHCICNLASGIETPISDLAAAMGRVLARPKPISCQGKVIAGDPLRWCAQMSRTKGLIPDWNPRPLHAGLQSCIAQWESSVASKQI